MVASDDLDYIPGGALASDDVPGDVGARSDGADVFFGLGSSLFYLCSLRASHIERPVRGLHHVVRSGAYCLLADDCRVGKFEGSRDALTSLRLARFGAARWPGDDYEPEWRRWFESSDYDAIFEAAVSLPPRAELLSAFAAGYQVGLRRGAQRTRPVAGESGTSGADTYRIRWYDRSEDERRFPPDIHDTLIFGGLAEFTSHKSSLVQRMSDLYSRVNVLSLGLGGAPRDYKFFGRGLLPGRDAADVSPHSITFSHVGIDNAGDEPSNPRLRDVLGRAIQAFGQALEQYLASDDDLVDSLSEEDVEDLAEQAADHLLAPLLWSRAVGDKFDTTQVTQVLGITRQAVAKRVAGGSLLGIPGRGTTYFPAWQFDLERRAIKPEVPLIIAAFKESLSPLDPLTVATWATTGQDEDLDGMTPEEWILEGKGQQQLVEAAHRAAKRLAQ